MNNIERELSVLREKIDANNIGVQNVYNKFEQVILSIEGLKAFIENRDLSEQVSAIRAVEPLMQQLADIQYFFDEVKDAQTFIAKVKRYIQGDWEND